MIRTISNFLLSALCTFAVANYACAGSLILKKLRHSGCNAQMTCKINAVEMSLAQNSEPTQIPRSPRPPLCTMDALLTTSRPKQDIVADCENFAKNTDNGLRERATAMLVLGYLYRQIDIQPGDPADVRSRPAIKIWQSASTLDPTFIDVLLAVGTELALNGKYEQSQLMFDRAERINPTDWRIFLARAEVFQVSGNKLAALAASQHAYEMNPKDFRANYVYGIALNHVGKFFEATPFLLVGAQNFAQTPVDRYAIFYEVSPWLQLANNYEELKQPLKGTEALTSHFASQHSDLFDFEIYEKRAKLFAKAGQYKNAADDIAKAIELIPNGFPNDYKIKQAEYLIKAGKAGLASNRILEMLNEGKLKSILQIQVFLNNQGYKGVEINGKIDDATRTALNACLNDRDCSKAAGQAI
jgi:tetratricopeptide (TPR) repeat protein